MKKKVVFFLAVLIIFGLFLSIGITNKTFLNNYYEVTNPEGLKIKIPLPRYSYFKKVAGKYNVSLITLRNVSNAQKFINNYMDSIQSCYDESYFYDSNLDITINNYYTEKGFLFNEIHLTYNYGNYCEEEYVLNDDWVTEVINKAQINEINIMKCIVEKDNMDCSSKNVFDVNIKEVFDVDYLNESNRVENKKNVSINDKDNYFLVTLYYTIHNNNYILMVFKYYDYLAFKVVDSNDHPKNAVYDVDRDINQMFENIYENY